MWCVIISVDYGWELYYYGRYAGNGFLNVGAIFSISFDSENQTYYIEIIIESIEKWKKKHTESWELPVFAKKREKFAGFGYGCVGLKIRSISLKKKKKKNNWMAITISFILKQIPIK